MNTATDVTPTDINPGVLRIVGQQECAGAEVEVDPWIPLTVTWWPWRQVQPLYLRISGTFGGEVELKADPDIGALLEVIVIDEPPYLDADPRAFSADVEAVADATPILDRSLWLPGNDASVAPDSPKFVECRELAMFVDGDLRVLRLSGQPIRTRMHSQGVTVGVGEDGSLVTIEALAP